MLITLHNAGRGKIRYHDAHRLPPERNALARARTRDCFA